MARRLAPAAVVAVCAALAAARKCPSTDVRNDPGQLEKLRNCTVIVGHLHIVLVSERPGRAFDRYSFPELEEIEEHLLVYDVEGLTSLGRLFPNLRVVRGSRLYLNWAIVVYEVYDLREIGLTKLTHIGRGAVYAYNCPRLCYVGTVNWEALGAARLLSSKLPICERNETCPDECKGHCWNATECQRMSWDECHDLCVGCTKENSPAHCHSCKTFKDEDEDVCVETCPAPKVPNRYSMKCVTVEECTTMINGTWWVHDDTCVKECPIYHSKNDADGRCVHQSNHTKVCPGTVVKSISDLEELYGCTHINGSLQLQPRELFVEPYLDRNLQRIVSISGFLKVSRSRPIKSLEFFRNLRVIKGEQLTKNLYALFIKENENLQNLWVHENYSLIIENGTMTFQNNPLLCASEIDKLVEVTDFKRRSVEMTPYKSGYNLACEPEDLEVILDPVNPYDVTLSWRASNVVSYIVYYIEAMFGNVTKLDNVDSCDSTGWNQVSNFNNIAEIKSLFDVPTSNNSIEIKNLLPYRRYAYYIRTYSTKVAETPIYYFNTSTTYPSEPLNFTATALSDSRVRLQWQPPKYPNGPLSYYAISTHLELDRLSLVGQRDYCASPHTPPEVDDKPQIASPIASSIASPCNCAPKKKVAQAPKHQRSCGNDFDTCLAHFADDKRSKTAGHGDVSATGTSHDFEDLEHFSLYLFTLRACNAELGLCGAAETASVRTKRKDTADAVTHANVIVKGKNATVTWSEPRETNSMLVAYKTEYRNQDSVHSKAVFHCVTSEQYRSGRNEYLIRELIAGKYQVRVQAVSLAGPARFSNWTYFDIASQIGSPSGDTYWMFALIPVTLVIIAAVFLIIRSRMKRAELSHRMNPSINPNYAGPIYEKDEWEMERSDIEIIKELGAGSFGMVFQGLIKSRNYPCAIKTVTESATMPSRMEFLNEGSVMKTFSDAHHVIKLLGIVSHGQPPLVVMELMERGDLKSYLRRCREPSQNLTTNELYRMASEIADGMAYLAAKKFVHRDLAARNCMVAADRTVKIGDFGMARDIYETDYYRKETAGLLPVRWMAPESLSDGVFTSDSDVWSYGIVLWEMATLAEQPYQGLSNEEVFQFVKSKGRLERPSDCSDLLYEVMDACWMWRPNDRPTFADIVDKLVEHVGQDFRLVAFRYSQQGRDLALNAGPRTYNPPAMAPADEEHYGRYEEEERGETNRPELVPLSSQRFNNSTSYQYSPGSRSSAFSLDSN